MKNIVKLIWKPGDVQEIVAQASYAKSYEDLRKLSTSLPPIYKAAVVIDDGESSVATAFPLIIEKSGIYILDVQIKAGAHLNFSYINRAPQTESSLTIARFHVESGAALQSSVATFGGAHSTLFLETFLNGEESSVHENTVFWSDGEQIFDIYSTTRHFAKNTRSFVESKGIANEKSAVRFDGKIHITQPAHGSNARLNEHTLLLSPEARMFAIPGLTIDTNDVVANHAASMTRIDDEQLFYCESRGIPSDEAKRLIAEGFLKSSDLTEDFINEIQPLINAKLANL